MHRYFFTPSDDKKILGVCWNTMSYCDSNRWFVLFFLFIKSCPVVKIHFVVETAPAFPANGCATRGVIAQTTVTKTPILVLKIVRQPLLKWPIHRQPRYLKQHRQRAKPLHLRTGQWQRLLIGLEQRLPSQETRPFRVRVAYIHIPWIKHCARCKCKIISRSWPALYLRKSANWIPLALFLPRIMHTTVSWEE